MHARVSIFEAENPEQVDGMLRQVREVVLPQAKQMDGFKGLIHPSAWNRNSRKFAQYLRQVLRSLVCLA
jgi:hypothetical protein